MSGKKVICEVLPLYSVCPLLLQFLHSNLFKMLIKTQLGGGGVRHLNYSLPNGSVLAVLVFFFNIADIHIKTPRKLVYSCDTTPELNVKDLAKTEIMTSMIILTEIMK